LKLAILGLYKTFDYFQIGGTDSFMRRLCHGILSSRDDVTISWILYGANTPARIHHAPNFTSWYFSSLHTALRHISEERYEHVIVAYIHPADRLQLAKFRRRLRSTRFHSLVFFYPDSRLKRLLKFLEYVLFPYNGHILCVSRRQISYLRKLGVRALYLPPSVPDDYFVPPADKPKSDRIRVTFLGRIDPRKGIEDTIHLFQTLSEDPRFECTIYGICIPSDQDGLKIHHWLQNQEKIRYTEVKRQNYTPSVDAMVKKVLAQTDIFVQPYETLDSTVDTPLLLLESMASACAVLTTPVGDVPSIYAPSRFMIEHDRFVPDATELLHNLSRDSLRQEQERAYNRIVAMDISTRSIAERFLHYIA